MSFGDVYQSVLKEYPDIMSVEEMSRALGICSKMGYRLLRANKINHLRVGNTYRIPKAQLLIYMSLASKEATN